jgi:cytochrome b
LIQVNASKPDMAHYICMSGQREIRVWDPFVRFFHWSVVVAFLLAYLTEDVMLVHSWAGYYILVMVVLRLFWGFIGTRHARFRDFIYSPVEVMTYLKDLSLLRARHYRGHNPVGGWMVLLLLALLVLTGITGVVLYAVEDSAGPLAGLLSGSPGWMEDLFEELHEAMANFTLLMVFVHIAGVLVASMLHGENLVSAMLSGRKRLHPDD